jgi:hypothetical protein
MIVEMMSTSAIEKMTPVTATASATTANATATPQLESEASIKGSVSMLLLTLLVAFGTVFV